MKILIDTNERTIRFDDNAAEELFSERAFETLSDLWVRLSWNRKYSYGFSWFGRPLIQLPDDVLRIQEVVWHVQPDVLVETGIAHGGSLIFYASLFKAMEKGRVIGVDIEIRPQNREAIERHHLKPVISLVEGSSVDQDTLKQVKSQIRPGETVMVVLDSNHSADHVLSELNAYADLVTPGSYIVATDGIMRDLAGDPETQKNWEVDNPVEAVSRFLRTRSDFALVEPPPGFTESRTSKRLSYWPSAYLKRVE